MAIAKAEGRLKGKQPRLLVLQRKRLLADYDSGAYSSQPSGSGSITGVIDHSADAVGPPLPLSTFASAIELVEESSIGAVRKLRGRCVGSPTPRVRT